MKTYNAKATGNLYFSESFASIDIGGESCSIESIIFDMLKSLKKENELVSEARGTLNITFTREPDQLIMNGLVTKEEKA